MRVREAIAVSVSLLPCLCVSARVWEGRARAGFARARVCSAGLEAAGGLGDGTGWLEIHITRGWAGAVGTDRPRMQRDTGEESVQNLPLDRLWGWRGDRKELSCLAVPQPA